MINIINLIILPLPAVLSQSVGSKHLYRFDLGWFSLWIRRIISDPVSKGCGTGGPLATILPKNVRQAEPSNRAGEARDVLVSSRLRKTYGLNGQLGFSPGLNRLRKNSEQGWECVPQRLKPDLFSITYVRAEARTLQRIEFFRSL